MRNRKGRLKTINPLGGGLATLLFATLFSGFLLASSNTSATDATVKTANAVVNACIRNSSSRNVLIHQIESGLYHRQEIADKISNFENRLSAPQSEMVIQMMKDMNKPMGVSEYRVTSNLPTELKDKLPSVEDLQKRIK